MKILLVEDSERVASFVRKGLAENGHVVDYADNGRDGLFLASTERYDAMVLDRMLPGGVDGLGIIEALRKTGNKTPVLILSALADVQERIAGLRAGGDDYLTKPFAFGELAARLDALMRRSQASEFERVLAVGDRCCWKMFGTITSTPRRTSSTRISAICGTKSTPALTDPC
jgi:two-component system OmpR family response regulator